MPEGLTKDYISWLIAASTTSEVLDMSPKRVIVPIKPEASFPDEFDAGLIAAAYLQKWLETDAEISLIDFSGVQVVGRGLAVAIAQEFWAAAIAEKRKVAFLDAKPRIKKKLIEGMRQISATALHVNTETRRADLIGMDVQPATLSAMRVAGYKAQFSCVPGTSPEFLLNERRGVTVADLRQLAALGLLWQDKDGLEFESLVI